ncbi:hypothetical protein AUEXF2481DRAFT_694179 [Aureobasidium subglaciale EXF-2481]|uniref:DUF7587 domain-containing protein n=1 Tax=Aureobasidium subglaciale (strain EXF-2481) TaxID=1043005 RepID=A0A074ZAS1_AURSE|nr:uncharacterized protein AUEXF2481DRAFT_694179 [Aureobasidium subglaciale EXF-2481]KEQ95871.1 hypothetical protein AUEXF2481DRAFT_694179 [Aureobasidium subglaciale EXF-2481]
MSSCRLSIIDTQKIGPSSSISYARPYRDWFQYKKEFPWRYSVEEEHLAWAEISVSAVMTEVSLEDLQSFMVEDSVLSSAFNTDVSSGDIVEVCRALKAKRTALSSELVAAIARLIAFLGMELHTSPAIIAKLVCEVTHDWYVVLPVQSAEAWFAEAAVFAHSFVASQDCLMITDEVKYFPNICQAFLAGARTSLKDWTQHTEISQVEAYRTINRAIRVGPLSAEERLTRPVLC